MKKNVIHIILILSFFGCKKRLPKDTLFTLVPSSHSSILFQNTITENDNINVIDFQYCYNGGGVGIGDFNEDGLSDIIFTGNQVTSKLYLNLGNLKFKDISIESNFKTNSWITGVSIIDINADGLDDIYLNVGGSNCNNDCNNLLFINQGLSKKGIPYFKEQASIYGLDDGSYSQQTVFFDYDLDGDLDAYIVHNGNTKRDRNTPIPKIYQPKHLSDYLLENKTLKNTNQIFFSNVSDSMGITHKGFGLGVAINDFNNDNLPDIYISNDFITNDLLYINKGKNSNGIHLGFSEMNQQVLSKQTYNAMGVDVADINNDLLPDIMVVDMLPNDYQRQKKMLASNNYDKYLLSKRNGYTPQYVHNTLQIHNGLIKGQILPASEIGFASGIASTDWSWAPLIADYNNDGNKDIYITNGYVKDITDLDFINYSGHNNIFGTPNARKEKSKNLIEQLPGIHLPNVIYENKGNAQFTDVSSQWIDKKNSYSNGSAYADLDQDGDLDLIVNNINSPAFILENHISEKNKKFLRVKLKGTDKNKNGIGAKITLWDNGTKQTQYQSTIKGYLSSVEPIIHFGLHSEKVDSLKILWPNGAISYKKDIPSNQLIIIDHQNSFDNPSEKETDLLFQKDISTFSFAHTENYLNDYLQQSLLSHQFNSLGPCIISENVDNKQGEEIFIGGSKGFSGTLFSENQNGVYKPKQKFDTKYEDTAALFIDIDYDGDKDLYIGSGGTDAGNNDELLKDRIYINDGTGSFLISETKTLSKIITNTACVTADNTDNTGIQNIFVGGSVLTGKYPLSTPSYLITNQKGNLSINNNIPFSGSGIVTDATWADINNNKTKELIVVGQWMPISIYQIDTNKAKEIPIKWIDTQGNTLNMSGWWNSITLADIDNDGDQDILAGNQGINGYIKPMFNQAVYVYKKDFDNNGSIDPLLAQYFKTPNGLSLQPIHTRDDVMKQLVSLKKQYPTYNEFAKANFKELLNINNLEEETFSAHIFQSIYAENIGNNTFKVTFLPEPCQQSPINNFLVEDIDQDGFKDVLIVGNDYSAEASYGRHDAIIGIYLKGSEKGFIPTKNNKTGFLVPKQSNHIISMQNRNNEKLILATQNNDSTMVYRIQSKKRNALAKN
ncbi:VCBS repeat-containing protein [Aquimarina sp. MMG015]|uniref:VCBS repeat-containing protein n=1 Tax=Aquimarina sp. MMG015 TaxID=2822689 RepID=UPI001B3A53B8|nr:VCBS repeat-containing protein [Aquimarina sp. MMG015]MBQ4802833.1 VCBS repeat-containing protein [Aquimarina sp. MMG015]